MEYQKQNDQIRSLNQPVHYHSFNHRQRSLKRIRERRRKTRKRKDDNDEEKSSELSKRRIIGMFLFLLIHLAIIVLCDTDNQHI